MPVPRFDMIRTTTDRDLRLVVTTALLHKPQTMIWIGQALRSTALVIAKLFVNSQKIRIGSNTWNFRTLKD
jgi:hypothetical protein